MHHTAELVRSVLRWALMIVAREESSGGNRLPGPRLSQFCLGNLLLRTDAETSIAIAREIAALDGVENSDVHMEALVRAIQSGWGAGAHERPSRRTGAEDSVIRASSVVTALRQFSTSADRDLLENCASSRTWRKVEVCYHGRDWSSIRDDFERVARKFYMKESSLLCETAEYIVRITRK